MIRTSLLVAAGLAACIGAAHAAAPDCPNGGTVRFGVEPFEAAARLTPILGHIGDLLGRKIDCTVTMQITTSYNAEIEAMRAGRLEVGEFGPLGYVLAHQVAGAEAVAAYGGADGKPSSYSAGIVTWPGSGVATLKEVAGKSFAYSDPASTSGHLFPATALKQAGIDPDKGVKGFYAGSHTASFEALRNHKVAAGELNSQEIVAATIAGDYKPAEFPELWRSDTIPNDPIAVSSTLQPGFRARLVAALQSLDLHELPPDDLKILDAASGRTVPQTDAAFDGIRSLVSTLGLDLEKMNQ